MKLIVVSFTDEKGELAKNDDYSVLAAINNIINDYYYVTVPDSITIGDFLNKLTIEAGLESEISPYDNLYERYNFYTEYGLVEPDLNCRLINFLHNFHISPNNVQLCWRVCIGGGAGITFKNIVIKINSREKGHRNIPHVHVYKNKYMVGGKCVRIALHNLKEMKSNIHLNKLFSKKDVKLIMDVLREYNEEFTNYYNQVQLGSHPKTFFITIDGELYEFK